MIIKYLSLAIVIAITGCASAPKLLVEHPIDTTQKTITVPAGSEGLLYNIKQELIQSGWTLETDRGPVQTTGSTGATTSLQTHQTFNSRYRLLISWKLYALGGPNMSCFRKAYYYDISVIDNKTGQEAFTLSGMSCGPDDAGPALIKALDNQ